MKCLRLESHYFRFSPPRQCPCRHRSCRLSRCLAKTAQSTLRISPMGFPGGQVAPGGLISIFGQGSGPSRRLRRGLSFAGRVRTSQTQARINDQLRCRLLFVSDTQINCQLPDGLVGDRIRLRIETTLVLSDKIEGPLGPSGSGFFTQERTGADR